MERQMRIIHQWQLKMRKLSERTQFDPIYDCHKGTEDLQKYTTYSFVWGVQTIQISIQNASSLNKTRKLVSWYLLAKYILPIKPVALHLISLAHAMQIKVS